MPDTEKNLRSSSEASFAPVNTPPPRKVEAKDLGSVLADKKEELKDVRASVVRKAWFTLSHLLLPPGAHIVDMGCGKGDMAYAMAVLYPHIRVTAIDPSSEDVENAKEKYKRDNLEYRVGDITKRLLPEASVEAVISSFVIHEVYSSSFFSEPLIRETLANHFAMLKPDGLLFVRDYARPMLDGLVLMELPETESRDDTLAGMSDADLLLWFAEHAQPNQDPECAGFFLEELPAKLPGTRLFRLPYKWAYEFVMRKDDRSHWEMQLPKQFTYFTLPEYRKVLGSMGGRVTYSAPHWNESYIQKYFKDRFRLYREDGSPLDFPPTSVLLVCQKAGEDRSLVIEERRPGRNPVNQIQVQAMRDDKAGTLVDIVRRDVEIAELFPYRFTENGEVNIFLHFGYPRALVNAVPRTGKNLDGREWSGHMVEAVSLDARMMKHEDKWTYETTKAFMKDHLAGLKPALGMGLEQGRDHYPAPDYIDEKIETWYVQVEAPPDSLKPGWTGKVAAHFSDKGQIREFNAQHILNAISVGLIPSSRMEMQILALLSRLGVKAESWVDTPLRLEETDIESDFDPNALLGKLYGQDDRFKETRGSAGQIRSIHSVFVEEGFESGKIKGLGAVDVEFVIQDDETINTAVVLPLCKSLGGGGHGRVCG